MDMTNKLRNNFWNIRALANWRNLVRYRDHDPNNYCQLIVKCNMAMLKVKSVFNTRKKKELYKLKKFYKANLEIQYKRNVNVNVSDAIYAPKIKETKRVTFYIPDETETSRDIIEHKDVERPTEDDRAVKINIATNENEPNEDYTNVINVTENRNPTEDRSGTVDDVQIVQDGKITKKKIHIDPKMGN
jgi:hypothetical protein